MNSKCVSKENPCSINFAENECSDGMCCFTCVIPPDNAHIGFFKALWKSGTGASCIKLLVMSEGYKNELYDSCKFLDFLIYKNGADSDLKMDLRCCVYGSRPKQCADYPDRAGESLYNKISGPCIFNEYTAPSTYKKLVYKREWLAYYAIQDNIDILSNIFVNLDASAGRELLLKANGVYIAKISVGNTEEDYVLIPINKQVQNVLYMSEKHQPIISIRQAYERWEEKIQKNLQNHYGKDWETRLKSAVEMEEKDAGKRCNEDAACNTKC